MANVLQFPPAVAPSSLVLREALGNGKGELTAWFTANKGARAHFRVRVGHLRKTDRVEWNKKQFRKLDKGLAEIKWKSGKTQCRAIGFDHKGAFVMVVGCTHKMNVYDPPGALATAERIKTEVQNGKRSTAEFEP